MKRKMSQGIWIFSLSLFLILGCAVKDKGDGTNPTNNQNLTSGDLPKGVVLTKDKKYLVRPSTHDFKVGEVTVLYKVITEGLDALPTPELSVEVRYWMPTMPEMPVTLAKIKYPAPGQVEVTYNISMGGPWEITLKLLRNGAIADTLVYSFNVEE